MTTRQPTNLISVILRGEALAALIGGIAIWVANDGSVLWLAVFMLVPDVSMIGYLANDRIGALTYNAVHNLILAGALLGIGWWLGWRFGLLAGALLLAHVGLDRSLGYGLKLPTGFHDTHLGRIGRGRESAADAGIPGGL
jgi:Domain of unknown function (DUF4260)